MKSNSTAHTTAKVMKPKVKRKASPTLSKPASKRLKSKPATPRRGAGAEATVPVDNAIMHLLPQKNSTLEMPFSVEIEAIKRSIGAGIDALHCLATTDLDAKCSDEAVIALRDVASIFIRKFVGEAMQPWLAKLKHENSKLWCKQRHTVKRHAANQMYFVMKAVSYFDRCWNDILVQLSEIEKKPQSERECTPQEFVESVIDRVHHDDPGLQKALRNALNHLSGTKLTTRGKPELDEVLPVNVANVLWRDIPHATLPQSYLDVVWPYLKAEWEMSSYLDKSTLPKGVQSSGHKSRLSPGVFKKRCLKIITSLLADYPIIGVPMNDDAHIQSLLKHSK